MKNLTAPEWQLCKIVLDFFSKKTNCLSQNGDLIIKPKFVVANDDDMVSAKYAAIIMEKAYKQFGEYPTMLCCGGIGMMSKYLNKQADGTVISEGEKLKRTALALGNFPIVVLDKCNNTGAVVKQITDYVNDENAPIVFCPTQRMSKRLERTVVFSTTQFPGTKALNAYYYVHGETLEEILQLYNAKGIAGGLPLLSEAAALYDRTGTDKYVGKYMAAYDHHIPQQVHDAGRFLMRHYPVRVSRLPITAPIQFIRMFFGVVGNRKAIENDLQEKIKLWKQEL